MTIGIVVVSHSRPLAQAAIEFAQTMGTSKIPVVNASGIKVGDDWQFGTDSMSIADAISGLDADGCDSIVVLMDIGSSVMSTQMALEFIDPAIEVHLSPAPLVEGLIVAVSMAGALNVSGANVAKAAAEALEPKRQALDESDNSATSGNSVDTSADIVADEPTDTPGTIVRDIVILDPHGIHARPAAALAAAVGDCDAQVTVSNKRTGKMDLPANSMIELLMLDGVNGDTLTFKASGPEAQKALDLAQKTLDFYANEAMANPN